MNRDLIVYGYNNKNLGDDLMFASIINNTDYDNYYFYGPSIKPEFVNKNVQFIKYGRALPLRWKRSADFAVIGGSVVMGSEDKHFRMIKQKENFFLLNRLYGGRNFIVGANLGPYRDEQEYLGFLQRLNKRITRWLVRDSFSQELLEASGSTKSIQLPDIVMAFPIEPYLSIPTDKNIAISVTKVNKDGKGEISPEQYNAEILNLIKQYITQGYTVSMLSFEDSIDLDIIDTICLQLSDSEREQVTTVPYQGDSIIRAMAKAEIVVSTRFHCMVLGGLLRKRQIIYSYSKKTANFASDFGFTVYPVTGEAEGKPAIATQFTAAEIEAAKTYPNWMMK